MALLSRDDFRDAVFKRDNLSCCVPGCVEPAKDAHHIIERRLWVEPSERGGYFLSNGASVCAFHHQHVVETCALQPSVLRKWCKIADVKLPKGLDPTKSFDKWGIPIKRSNRKQIKYLSTPFLPSSPGNEENDINLTSLAPFVNQPLVVTIKMDGSNVCISKSGGVCARNGQSADHPSFSLLKEQFANIYHQALEDDIQIFGEWIFAKHSIHYVDEMALDSYFQIFSVYDQKSELFLGWDDVEKWAERLGVPTTPIIERFLCTSLKLLERRIQQMISDTVDMGHEGIVVRIAYPFPYGSFESYTTTNGKTSWKVAAIAKYVRPDHIQTTGAWGKGKIVKNEVVENNDSV